jgi:chromosomal replication initiation ATPase DnaA
MPASDSGPRQLALALSHPTSFAGEDFLEGPSNAAALTLVERWPDWPDRILALVGPEGCGKSHLAAIWARMVGAQLLSAHRLQQLELPSALATGALAIEDLPSSPATERALFHLLNLAREERAYMLLTARTAPAGWVVGIPDLASRLRAVPVALLQSPDDCLLRGVLIKLFADRQLAVDESVVAYVMTRIERSFAAARAAVAELDDESLRLQRPLTRALAVETLGHQEA